MKSIKIAFHPNKGGFSEYWIEYCKGKGIDFKIVNYYSTTIIQDVKDCDIVMFHPLQLDYKADQFFRQLQYSLEISGKKVFPDFRTIWHFDDKVGQKYLLEAIGAPLVPTYVFYEKQEAINWSSNTTFPKVFKLRTGAGSKNVRLVKSPWAARRLIKKAFGKGFRQYNKIGSLKERLRKYRERKTNLTDVLKGFYRLVFDSPYSRLIHGEKGYVYFQDFIPNNEYDIRVCVIGNKAFAIKRYCRKNDFRASGSGNIIYDRTQIDECCIKIAFDVNDKIEAQAIAFDFVFEKNGDPRIIEISYGFRPGGYHDCPGYWDKDLTWNEGRFNPYGWMIDKVLKEI